MKKLITIPDEIYDILNKYKETTGISMSAYIQEALYKKLIHDRLMVVKTTPVYVGKKLDKKIRSIQQMPEGIKYCDGDKCEIPIQIGGNSC